VIAGARRMGFVLEEWVGEANPYRRYPILQAGSFATRAAAREAAKNYQPQHGGFICVEPEPTDEKPALRTRRRKSKLPHLRENKRPHRR